MKVPASEKVPAIKVPAGAKSPGPVKGPAVATDPAAPRKVLVSKRYEAMIEVTKAYPTIFYELRYATTRNFTHQQIYPAGARCLLRKSVALRLQHAQEELRRQGYGLKIWDAYRPAWAHAVALRAAMLGAGFRGLRDEWWHFTAKDANQFCPMKMALVRGGRE